VKDLRVFRDGFLKNKAWGNAFINWYYDKGPKYANIIEKSIFLRFISRLFIIIPLHLFIKFFKIGTTKCNQEAHHL
jgi:hypothetical protein